MVAVALLSEWAGDTTTALSGWHSEKAFSLLQGDALVWSSRHVGAAISNACILSVEKR